MLHHLLLNLSSSLMILVDGALLLDAHLDALPDLFSCPSTHPLPIVDFLNGDL